MAHSRSYMRTYKEKLENFIDSRIEARIVNMVKEEVRRIVAEEAATIDALRARVAILEADVIQLRKLLQPLLWESD